MPSFQLPFDARLAIRSLLIFSGHAIYLSPAISLGLLVNSRRRLDLACVVVLLVSGYVAWSEAMNIDSDFEAVKPLIPITQFRVGIGSLLISVCSFLGGVFF